MFYLNNINIKKLRIFVIFFLYMFLFCGCENSHIEENNNKLEAEIENLKSETVKLHEVTDFEWDKAYSFAPYSSKGEIEKIIGFQSKEIIDDIFSDEGSWNLLFVKDNIVVANVSGQNSNSDIIFDFGTFNDYVCITSDEDVEFLVTKNRDSVTLTYKG